MFCFFPPVKSLSAAPLLPKSAAQETPLMVAAQRGSVAHCQLLLQVTLPVRVALPETLSGCSPGLRSCEVESSKIPSNVEFEHQMARSQDPWWSCHMVVSHGCVTWFADQWMEPCSHRRQKSPHIRKTQNRYQGFDDFRRSFIKWSLILP